MLSQKILQGLFRALDLAEELRTAVNRMRGKPGAPPPWEMVPAAPPPAPAPAAARASNEPTRHDDDEPPAPRPRKPAKKAAPARKAKAHKAPKAAAETMSGDVAPLHAALDEGKLPVLTDAMEVEGRNLLARIVWGLACAEKVLGRGISGPQVADLLRRSGAVTAPNNIMRAVRLDGGRLFGKAQGEGRAVLLTLTDEGRAQARGLGLLG